MPTTEFTYPRNAKELPRPQSPLLSWYGGSAPAGTYVSRTGVVTSIPTNANSQVNQN